MSNRGRFPVTWRMKCSPPFATLAGIFVFFVSPRPHARRHWSALPCEIIRGNSWSETFPVPRRWTVCSSCSFTTPSLPFHGLTILAQRQQQVSDEDLHKSLLNPCFTISFIEAEERRIDKFVAHLLKFTFNLKHRFRARPITVLPYR